jgi:HicB family
VDAADAPQEEGAAREETGSAARTSAYSGRLLLRMPERLHEALALRSEAEHLSLNAFINEALEKAVDRRGTSSSSQAKAVTRGRSAVRAKGSRTVSRLLVANLIVVAVVGILAVVLLVRAL